MIAHFDEITQEYRRNPHQFEKFEKIIDTLIDLLGKLHFELPNARIHLRFDHGQIIHFLPRKYDYLDPVRCVTLEYYGLCKTMHFSYEPVPGKLPIDYATVHFHCETADEAFESVKIAMVETGSWSPGELT